MFCRFLGYEENSFFNDIFMMSFFYIGVSHLFRNYTSVSCKERSNFVFFLMVIQLFYCHLLNSPSFFYFWLPAFISYYISKAVGLFLCFSILFHWSIYLSTHKPISHYFNCRSFIMFSYLEGNLPHIVPLF